MERLELVKHPHNHHCDICFDDEVTLVKYTAINNGKTWICQECLREMLGMFGSIKLCKTSLK